MHNKDIKTERFSHLASIIVLMLVFGLIVSTMIFVTFFILGVNIVPKGLVNPLSITSGYCNETGTFITLKNNLDSNVSISYAQMNVHNSTILLHGLYDTPLVIAAGKELTVSSDSYICPSFESLNTVTISVALESAINIKYSFNNIYLFKGNIKENMTSSTVTK